LKYRFSIIAPHPDDEMIGCREFFRNYRNNINNVIFVTNGERSVVDVPDLVQYADMRRSESEAWIKNISPYCQIHYLNLPDGMDIIDYAASYPFQIFSLIKDSDPITYVTKKLQKIVGDDIVLVPQAEGHPSHKFAFNLAEMTENKKIYYLVHSLLKKRLKEKAGVYYFKNSLVGKQYFNYFPILSDSELIEKRKEFEVYFPSQIEGFNLSKTAIQNWEGYCSEVPLKLAHEDLTYLVKGRGLRRWQLTS